MKITIDDCINCVHHASFREGAVMCKFWHREEQRMTQIIGATTVLINCPRSEEEAE